MLDMQDTLFGIAARLTDDELLRRVRLLATREREATVELVAHLAELDTRKLHLAQGYGSLFSYCTEVLRLAEHAAYNRIEAARASRKLLPVDEARRMSGSEEDVLSEEVAMQEDARRGRREMVARPRQARSSFGRVELVEHEKRLLGVSPPHLVAGKQAGEGRDVERMNGGRELGHPGADTGLPAGVQVQLDPGQELADEDEPALVVGPHTQDARDSQRQAELGEPSEQAGLALGAFAHTLVGAARGYPSCVDPFQAVRDPAAAPAICLRLAGSFVVTSAFPRTWSGAAPWSPRDPRRG
jgi:hypothetical protein